MTGCRGSCREREREVHNSKFEGKINWTLVPNTYINCRVFIVYNWPNVHYYKDNIIIVEHNIL